MSSVVSASLGRDSLQIVEKEGGKKKERNGQHQTRWRHQCTKLPGHGSHQDSTKKKKLDLASFLDLHLESLFQKVERKVLLTRRFLV